MSKSERLALTVAVVLVACAAYETVLALGWVSLGADSGSDAPGADATVIVTLLAMLAAAVLLAVRPTRAALALAPLAVLVVLARLFTYDAYYAPTLRRMSDGGLVSPWWIALLAVAAALTAVSRRLAPVAVVVLVAAAGTLLVESAGH